MAYSNQLSRAFRRSALVPVVAVAIAGGAAGAATAAAKTATDVSSNWSGYVVAGTDASTGGAKSFSSVSGTWVQPAADCTTSTAGSTASAFWVGLGGDSTTSSSLEQTGTEADCTVNGTARYSAWYELVPAGSVRASLKVAAGDTISAAVAVDGTKVSIQLKNVTTGASYSKTLAMASPDTSSAEWITEAPSFCTSSGRCQQTTLTNFGTIKFSNASATSNGHTGSISDSAWIATAIQLVAQGGPGGFRPYATQVTAAEAVPTALRSRGGAFSVKWLAGSSAAGSAPSGSGGFGPGYGY